VCSGRMGPDRALASAAVTGPPRMLLVHAHPDDESIGSGATIAAAVLAGVAVTLLTCTRGEEGESMLPGIAGRPAPQAGTKADSDAGAGDRLGEYRVGELRRAMAALGVSDHRFLAAPGYRSRFRDSGMAGSTAAHPDRFAAADLLHTGTAVAAVLREVRPHVLLTYDEVGGYGHPDHIAAHRAAMYATQLAAAPYRPDLGRRWSVPKVYWSAAPRSDTLRGLAAAGHGLPAGLVTDPLLAADPAHWFRHPDPDAVHVTDDELVTTRIDATAVLPAKKAALRAHATQLAVSGDRFALTNGIAQPLSGIEWYRLVVGTPVPGPDGFETDLFAGLDLS
jgi:N-acetyl-1-D-myo-inositol-2-amino-2-deoxy-alpha-D-glucopyranoside deacetylase